MGVQLEGIERAIMDDERRTPPRFPVREENIRREWWPFPTVSMYITMYEM